MIGCLTLLLGKGEGILEERADAVMHSLKWEKDHFLNRAKAINQQKKINLTVNPALIPLALETHLQISIQ